MRSLLSSDRASVDDRGPDGYTALHFAASFGQLEVARLLLGRGADPNAVAMNGSRLTPLHSAIVAKHRDTTSLLLALGASPNSVQHGGITPLHIAAQDGDEAIVDMLLLRGADPTRKRDDGKTPIELAAENGIVEGADVECRPERGGRFLSEPLDLALADLVGQGLGRQADVAIRFDECVRLR